jgi:predicted enzyme related to lactoylglutathione lyase
MISTGDADALKKFYSEVFGKPADEMEGWLVGNTYLGVLQHSEVKGKSSEGPRIMFNIETDDVQGEFDRISKIEGVEVVKAPYQMPDSGWDGWISTLADPDGNYFQLMTPWEPNNS